MEQPLVFSTPPIQHMHRGRRVAHIPKPQLGIQIHVVVPGQPVDRVQLTIGQSHHLGEAGGQPIDIVDHPLGRHDIHIADDLHGTIVHGRTS